MQILSGKEVAAKVLAEVKAGVAALRAHTGVQPTLAVILVGDDPGWVRVSFRAGEDDRANRLLQRRRDGEEPAERQAGQEGELRCDVVRDGDDARVLGTVSMIPATRSLRAEPRASRSTRTGRARASRAQRRRWRSPTT